MFPKLFSAGSVLLVMSTTAHSAEQGTSPVPGPVLALSGCWEGRGDQIETSALFELIAHRYERHSIAITANRPFSAWSDVFPDPAMTVAAIDRLVHYSTIIEMNGESYRKRSAIARTSAMQNPVAADPAEIADERST